MNYIFENKLNILIWIWIKDSAELNRKLKSRIRRAAPAATTWHRQEPARWIRFRRLGAPYPYLNEINLAGIHSHLRIHKIRLKVAENVPRNIHICPTNNNWPQEIIFSNKHH